MITGSRHITPLSALELTMRDVLEGMADFALDFGFNCEAAGMELIAIESAPSASAQVIRFDGTRRQVA